MIASAKSVRKVAQAKPTVEKKAEPQLPQQVQRVGTSASIMPTQPKVQPVQQPKTVQPVKQTQTSAPVINAGVGTVKLASAGSAITTSQVKNVPTTNVKLAESYYIRGLQKCVLRDLQGAVTDLNKAIENNSNYADAYYYRAAIRKELGDSEGFKKDYAKAIQINPSLQAFNDSNCLSLING